MTHKLRYDIIFLYMHAMERVTQLDQITLQRKFENWRSQFGTGNSAKSWLVLAQMTLQSKNI